MESVFFLTESYCQWSKKKSIELFVAFITLVWQMSAQQKAWPVSLTYDIHFSIETFYFITTTL